MTGQELYESRQNHKGVTSTSWAKLLPKWQVNWEKKCCELDSPRKRKFKGSARITKTPVRPRVARREAERRLEKRK